MTELERLTKRKCWSIAAADWLDNYKKAINKEHYDNNVGENFDKLHGYIWGLSSCGKITDRQRRIIIDELLTMWKVGNDNEKQR